MKLIATAIIAALMLSACASTQQQTNMNALAAVQSTYGSALSVAVGYAALPRCAAGTNITATNVCSSASVVAALAAADKQAQPALAAARSFVAANPTLDASSVIQAAVVAVNALVAAETTNGVK